ncbi:tetratricopeptide repeat protein [Thermotoga sp.]|uniref:tetratricopeptide repeat protein n=1 Tax=Thermotoga sp. TaxID=28240 RepID=UPI0025E257E7|nr:tetratricopeptide repeat protein [Thermotoga sp.]MCD6551724.1 tetratricopeptide repeat protein [Thermotoga sp.]
MSLNEFEEAYFDMKSGKLDSALEKFLRLAEEDPSAELWINIGNIYRRKKLLAKAMESYKRAIEMDPESAEAFFNMGCTYYQMGKYFEALNLMKKAEDLGLKDSRVKIVKALCKVKLNFPNPFEGLSDDEKKLVKDLTKDG